MALLLSRCTWGGWFPPGFGYCTKGGFIFPRSMVHCSVPQTQSRADLIEWAADSPPPGHRSPVGGLLSSSRLPFLRNHGGEEEYSTYNLALPDSEP